MILRETPPASVERSLRKVSGNAEAQITIASDIVDGGQFGEQWLVATADHIMVFSPDGHEASLRKKLSLRDLKEVKTQSLIGSGALEATTCKGELV